MKILLAVDGSEHTRRMLAYLAAHDEVLGAQHHYTALCVVEPMPTGVRTFVDEGTLDSYYDAAARAVLDPIEAFARQQRWPLTAVHTVGVAAGVISDTATRGRFDLLVMGSHGHSAVAGVVMGSVVTRVLAQCKTPLLVVR
jgi:nucleotide-binding universal stress UspA family protein